MTTTAIPPVAAALTEPTAETHGWETRGPFDLERWEGSTWAVHHTVTDTLLAFCATPAECREYIDGGTQADLERVLAHEPGEHAGRDPRCGRCG